MDEGLPPQGPQALRAQAHGLVVRGPHARPRLQRHLLLHQAHRGAGRRLGRPPGRHQEHLREAGHPRGRAQVPVRGDGPVRERSRVPPQSSRPGGAGRPVLRHGHGGTGVPRARPPLVRHAHPAQRQQVRRPELGRVVRWVVHLRAARGQGGDAAAGLLPDQCREHGPVRAHADHRRRRLPGALHRRVLGSGLHDRLPALRRRRTGRPARGRASPTRPFRTGRPTSTTWSPSEPGPRPKRTSSGSTGTSGRA